LLLCACCLQHDEGWIATWKSKYWLPWCVARTRPVKNLLNLYQEFTSYKLRYACTWDEVGWYCIKECLNAVRVLASCWQHHQEFTSYKLRYTCTCDEVSVCAASNAIRSRGRLRAV
jgi:hypothetical protein